MLFQSWEYLVLLTLSLLTVVFARSVLLKKAAILAFSMLFYAYGCGWQTLLFVFVITLAYLEGIIVEKHRNKLMLCLMMVIIFLPLFLYKYLPFLLTEFIGAKAAPVVEFFVLPIGISFYTFQAAGYVMDVYKDNIRAEKSYLNFACFISFFPQLVAGPIERCSNLMRQINRFERPTGEDLSIGFRHILLGLCLKLLVAETMADFVDPVYNHLSDRGGLAVLIATFCFGVQIYCDFNGYTQIAIGSAKLMGIDLIQNFNHPYRAVSISDFWRRWHISLSSWFRDYLYIPLGGSRRGIFRTVINTIITFSVSGIWHGANWTFALWGFANGICISLEKLLKRNKPTAKSRPLAGAVLTYIVINLLWVLFRANSIQDAMLAYTLIATDALPQLLSLNSPGRIVNFLLRENGWSNSLILPMIASILIYVWYEYGEWMQRDLSSLLHSKKAYVRWTIYMILILLTLYLGKTLEQSSFVYFRF